MTGVRGLNATVYHRTHVPRDDRPTYLMADPYYIAVDTETTGLDWHLGDWKFNSLKGKDLPVAGDRPFLATVSDYDRDWVFHLDNPLERRQLRKAVLGADGLLMHNAPFDVHMLAVEGILTYEELLAKPLYDTKIEAQVILGEGNNKTGALTGFGLKDLATALVDPDAGEPERKIKEAMLGMGLITRIDQRDIPRGAYYYGWRAYPELFEEYAWKDTRYTYDLFYILQQKMQEDHRRVLVEIERPVTPTLIRMERRGIALNTERVDELHHQSTEACDGLARSMAVFNGGEPFDAGKRDQTIAYLQRNGVELTDLTDGGELRVDRWVLGKHEGNPAVDTLLEYRVHDKLLTTYLGPMKGRSELHTSFMQAEAWTGRMSSRRPNLQNLPVRRGPELRSAIVPRQGYAFVQADYGQIEFRLLAHYMHDEELKAKIARGNPFRELGAQIYGTEDESKWAVAYSSLKNGYYALIYGAGGPKLASTIGGGMTADQGRALARQLKSALGPKYAHLNQRIRAAVKGKGYVVTLGGRVQRIAPDKAYIGLSGLIQGSAADIMKFALRSVEDGLSPIGGHVLLVVHDEILAEVPLGSEEEGRAILCERMLAARDLAALEHPLELAVEGKVCYNNYGEAK